MEKWPECLNKLKLIIYDFDGVMTNNKVQIDEFGHESVIVNRGDGYAISQIKMLGIEQVIISTEMNQVVKKRAEKLDIPIIHGVSDKQAIVAEYCNNHNFELENVAFIGNDLNDYWAMKLVGLPLCPYDAEIEIQKISIWKATSKGGDGVIRELYRHLMESAK